MSTPTDLSAVASSKIEVMLREWIRYSGNPPEESVYYIISRIVEQPLRLEIDQLRKELGK